MKTLSDFNFKGKTVLLRSDLNSNVVNGKVLLGGRIKESAKTIKELKKKKAKIVVIAHQGQKGKATFASLRQHAKYLNKLTKIKFIDDLIGKKAINEIKNLKPGQAILLENLRFEEDEFHPQKGKKNKLIKILTPLFNVYVNDAFSVCHRKHASIIGFPKYLKGFGGRLLEKEVIALKKINLKNCLYVLGGSKPGDYLPLLKGNRVLACGLFGQSCLIAKGIDLGAQNKYLSKEVSLNQALKDKLKKRLKNVITPLDFGIKVNNKRKDLDLSEFPSKYKIFDIGPKTRKEFIKKIKKTKAVYMKGPVGDFSSKGFEKGTFEILRAISKSKGFSLIGGGHLNDAIAMSKIPRKKFDYISLSGGALLKMIAGEKLPGLEALKK